MSLMNVLDQAKTIQYAGTSVYLAVAAILFAACSRTTPCRG